MLDAERALLFAAAPTRYVAPPRATLPELDTAAIRQCTVALGLPVPAPTPAPSAATSSGGGGAIDPSGVFLMLLVSTPEIGTALTRYSLGRSPWFYPPEHLCLISPAAVRQLFEPLGCVLQTVSRLELNPLRYAARYGIGMAAR